MKYCGREYTAEELKKGIRNPFFHALNKEVTVAVDNEVYDIYAEASAESGFPVEVIMGRCIETFSKTLQEAE
ncbi:hypothetical protein FACS1894120_7120 [Clostridia bacterium]|nr:hypothetical protein FACS1894120_7120 [Clostridia bacterium]